jgi:predicted ThiF/HesA family dinucleotide-utilizing enzyme
MGGLSLYVLNLINHMATYRMVNGQHVNSAPEPQPETDLDDDNRALLIAGGSILGAVAAVALVGGGIGIVGAGGAIGIGAEVVAFCGGALGGIGAAKATE